MKFINRTEELQRLTRAAASGKGGLVALWGRRRIGKTRLLLEWVTQRDGLYTVADESAEPIQRKYFAAALAQRFSGFDDVVYPDWRTLLRAAARRIESSGWRGPLVLDEFVHLVVQQPALPSILQNWIDHDATRIGLLVAIAGSTQRLMQGLIMDPAAPLFGRSMESIRLAPLRAGHISDALSLTQARRAIEAYTAFGGVPWYWELAVPFGNDIESAVDQLILDPHGVLHLEPDRLLREESPPAVSLRPLLDVIGAGAHRVSEMGGRLGLPATSLGRPLARVVELGIVAREHPFGAPEKKAKRTLYTIGDPFFRLWFRLVAPNRALLTAAPPAVRRRLWREKSHQLTATTWETLCRESVPRLRISGGTIATYGPWQPAYRYWGRGEAEWDVVAWSIDGSVLLLGEAKWRERAVTRSTLDRIYADLLQKGVPRVTGTKDLRVIHAVFVPSCAPRLNKADLPYAVIDAKQVLNALR